MIRLTLENISKTFPGVKALQDINLSIEEGEVHALCGENGAGKSTLMNILMGNYQPDAGAIRLNGVITTIDNPKEANHRGIAIVYQHLSLVDNLSIAENIYANLQPTNTLGFIDFNKLNNQAKELLAELQIRLDPQLKVSKLSAAQKQMIEIAKALSKNPGVLILDEPTASLSENETSVLFRIIRKLKQQNVSIIYISHRLAELFEISDRVTILRDGMTQGTYMTDTLTREMLINKMVGRDLRINSKAQHVRPDLLLEVRRLTGKKFHDITFILHPGEIVGLAGLVGAGRTEVARAIFGIDEYEGEILIRGEVCRIEHPEQAIQKGIGYVPEERKTSGLFMDMDVEANIIVASFSKSGTGNLHKRSGTSEAVQRSITQLNIKTPSAKQKVANLSGGNQQKVVLAKWLLTQPDILIVDEPTHGIDIGAKNEVYQILNNLAEAGKGILIISSELPELLSVCHRILVMKSGRISGELLRAEATEEKILALAM